MKHNNFNDVVLEEIDKRINKALYSSAILVEENAVLLAAVDSGNLRKSINFEVDESEKIAYIGTNVEYAPHIEYGTKKSRPYPFLRPAVDNNRNNIENIFRKSLKI